MVHFLIIDVDGHKINSEFWIVETGQLLSATYGSFMLASGLK